jgi:hypothetical protein
MWRFLFQNDPPQGEKMKKKIVIAIALAAILATGTAFAVQDGLGIGIVGGGHGGWGGAGTVPGFALSLKLPSVPVYWGINLGLGNPLWLGVSGDFIHLIDNKALVKDIGLSWFIRLGLYGKIWLGSDVLALDAGARLPIGLSWQPVKLFEIFIDAVPRVGVSISDGIHLGGGWSGELGIRLWF